MWKNRAVFFFFTCTILISVVHCGILGNYDGYGIGQDIYGGGFYGGGGGGFADYGGLGGGLYPPIAKVHAHYSPHGFNYGVHEQGPGYNSYIYNSAEHPLKYDYPGIGGGGGIGYGFGGGWNY